MPPEASRNLLRHTVATLAYRGGKTLRDAPESFASFAGENYFIADIAIGRVGREQAAPKREFE